MRHIFHKHIMVLFSIMLLVMGNVPAMAYDFVDNGIYYNLIPTAPGEVEVTFSSSTGNSYNGAVTIPAQAVNNGEVYSVTAVGDNAFAGCTGLTSVTIGDNVTAIGKKAFFNCSSLTAMNITAAVASIGDYAFAGCSGLVSVSMNNDDPLEIGNGAFMECTTLNNVKWESYERLDGKGGLTTLGTNAFTRCSSLAGIMLPGNLRFLGTTVFSQCPNLTSITVMNEKPLTLTGDHFDLNASQVTIYVPSSGVQGVTAGLYNNANGWKIYNISELPYTFIDNNGYTYLKSSPGEVALSGRIPMADDVVVRSSIKDYNGELYNVSSITDGAFKGSSIKSFDSSKSLKLRTIGTESFANCLQLTHVAMNEGLIAIGNKAFLECEALTSIQVPSTVQTIPYKAFYLCTALSDVNLVMGVANIGTYAFGYCISLTSINLPKSLRMVENGAFIGCKFLTQVNVESGCICYTSIDGVLYELKYGAEFPKAERGKPNKLVLYPRGKAGTSYFIPCGVTSIEDNAIEKVTNLKSLAIPNTVEYFGNSCFNETNLETINYRTSNPVTVTTNALNASLKAGAVLQVPVGSINVFRNSDSWKDFDNIVERYDVYQNDEFVYDWNSRQQVSLIDIKPAAVDAAGKLTVPNAITLNGYSYYVSEIVNTATSQVAQLVKNLALDTDSLAVIDTSNDLNPLAVMTSLQNISITAKNPYFKVDDGILFNKRGNLLYYYLHSKTNTQVVIPNTVDSIMTMAFANNVKFNKVVFNDRLRYLGVGAFENCTSLIEASNATALFSIDRKAFAGCSALKYFYGGEGLEAVGNEAFLNCSNLRHFPFGHGLLKRIDNYAFKGCEKLQVIVMSPVLHTLGDGAFEGCSALANVFFNSSVSNFGQQVFKGCSALNALWLCNTTPPAVGTGFFEPGRIGEIRLYVPVEAANLYKTTAPWSSAKQVSKSALVKSGADVNNDGYITSADVTMVYDFLMGNSSSQIVGSHDVNDDGVVTSADITMIYDFLLGRADFVGSYNFVQMPYHNTISHYVSINGQHQVVIAVDNGNGGQNVNTGLQGIIDNYSVAHIDAGTTNGTPHLEIVPTAAGYCTLVPILYAGGVFYYHPYPLIVID